GRSGQRKYCERCSPPRRRKGAVPANVIPLPTGNGSCRAAVLTALRAAQVEHTVGGAVALLLAERLDSGTDSGSAIATLAKQLQATLADALRGTKVKDSPLDELRRRRDGKRN
ncbi:MAG: hypothetical protein WCI74_12765, partial [Actinomycetes bacterium]